jgi:signal peptidase I
MSMFPLKRFRVADRSMEPTFHEGDFVVLNRWAYLFSAPKINDVVVVQDPSRILLKRIKRKQKEGYFLQGDNQFHSRVLGPVKKEMILGEVIWRICP